MEGVDKGDEGGELFASERGDADTVVNPSRSDIGRISKRILDRIIPLLRLKVELHQWGSTESVIDWFDEVADKSKSRFIQWDISSYYPTISPILLNKSLLFARTNAGLKYECPLLGPHGDPRRPSVPCTAS